MEPKTIKSYELDRHRECIFVGLLGGTTFSTFGLDTFTLARTQRPFTAAANVLLQAGEGVLAAWLGYHLGTSGR